MKQTKKEEITSVKAALSGCSKDGAGKRPVILMVSFGTSYNDSRERTIGAIERAVAAAFPGYEVRRAFTSQIIVDILKERDNLKIDNMEEALARLMQDGVKTLVVQPTHVMSGYEYDEMMARIDRYRDRFDSVAVGTPLLSSDEDYQRVVRALMEETGCCQQSGTAVVFMGHGTEHAANAAYARLQKAFTKAAAGRYLVGTVEAVPSLDDVIAAARKGGYTKVVLEPLMVVAGDHANNDMAGEKDGSWKTAFEAAGFEVQPVLKGLGEIEAIRQIYVDHAQCAIDTLEKRLCHQPGEKGN